MKKSSAFHYPRTLQVTFAMGTAFSAFCFVGCALSHDASKQSVLTLALLLSVFGGFGALFLLLCWSTLPSLQLGPHGLVWRRLSQRLEIPYEQITRLEHRVAAQALIIHAGETRVRVEKQLRDYQVFYDTLVARMRPQPRDDEAFELPCRIRMRISVAIFGWAVVALGVGLLVQAVLSHAFNLALAGVGTCALGVAGVLRFPRGYVLNENEIVLERWTGPLRFQLSDLQRVDGVKTDVPLEMGGHTLHAISLTFANGKTLGFSEAAVAFPIEKLKRFFEERLARNSVSSS